MRKLADPERAERVSPWTAFLPLLLAGAAGAPAQAAGVDHPVEEIVVTARKREESLQSTPLSVSVFSAVDIDARKVVDLSQLGAYTPNMEFDFTAPISGSSNVASVFIRGVGQTDYVPSKDPGVGIYVDGVYIARTVGSVLSLLDVERVEILRGPQGTLFGKNTVGGAINVISQRPGTDFRAVADATIGRFNRADLRLSVDTPWSENVRARWTVTRSRRDGYMDRLLAGDDAGGDREYGTRLAVEWVPSPRFSAFASLDYSRANESGTASKLLSTDARVPQSPFSIGDLGTIFAGQAYNVLIGAPTTGASTLFPFLPPLPPGTTPFDRRWVTAQPYQTNATGPNYSEHRIFGTAVTLTWSLPAVTVRSISGFRSTDAAFGRDPDGSPLVIAHTEVGVDYQQASQELHVAGSALGGRLDWLSGLYYMNEDGKQRDRVEFVDETFRIYEMLGIDFPNLFLVEGPFSENTIDSFAAFGEISLALTAKLGITTGLRWTRETRDTLSRIIQGGAPTVLNPHASLDVSETSGRVIVDYKFDERTMTYASVSEGFKSGGFNHRLARPAPNVLLDAPTRFEPEKLTSYELGLKTKLVDGRLRFNAAAFHSDYKNIQVVVSDSGIPRTVNAAAGEIDGLELEAEYVARGNWRAMLAWGYMDARYTRLDASIPGATGDPVSMPLTLDTDFVNTPEHSLAVGLEKAFRPAPALDLRLRADATYRSEIANDSINTPEARQDAVWLVGAGLTLLPAACNCEIDIFGENLTDETYIVSGGGASREGGFGELILASPREWGIRLRYRFE